jgi:hypothetical protein
MGKKLGGVFVILGTFVFNWFFSHLLWDWFKSYLQTKWEIKEADMIASASGYVICALIGLMAYLFLIKVFSNGKSSVYPDMPISDVVNYVVNKSSVKLKRPKPPEIAKSGFAEGYLLIPKGVEHQDALVYVQTALNNGTLRSWGKREIGPGWFEDSLREIPKEYWESACMNPLFCFHNSNQAQTVALPEKDNVELYANLTLNKKEVKLSCPPKPLWRRFFGKQSKQITY